MASSSIADSSANMPGHSPGARIQKGVGTSSRASRCVVERLGTAYIIAHAHSSVFLCRDEVPSTKLRRHVSDSAHQVLHNAHCLASIGVQVRVVNRDIPPNQALCCHCCRRQGL